MELKKRSMPVYNYTVTQMQNGDWQAEGVQQIRRMNMMQTPRATGGTRQQAIDNLCIKVRNMLDVGRFEESK